jgi:hypothetical protein
MFSKSEVDLKLVQLGRRIGTFNFWRKDKRNTKIWRQIISKLSLQLTGEFMFFAALCDDKAVFRSNPRDLDKVRNECKLVDGQLCCVYKCPKVLSELSKAQKKYHI